MTLPFSIDSQAFLAPWNEGSFVYTSKRTAGDVAVTLPRCAYYPGQYAQAAPSNLVFAQADADATFGFSDIGAVVPKPGDTLTPPGRNPLVVLSVQEGRMLQFWKVRARDLALAYSLQDTATIYRPASTPGEDGLRTATEAVLEDNVAARVQPVGMTTENDTDGGYTTRERYTAYLDTSAELFAGDVVGVGDQRYRVTGQANRQQADTLVTVECERVV